MALSLVVVTWSYEDTYDVSDHMLLRSFRKHNPDEEVIQIHFNRSNYSLEEREFLNTYGSQYEFVLYRIFLLEEKLAELSSEYVTICDTPDVTCVNNIEHLPRIFDLDNYVVFGMEKNQWPMPMVKEKYLNYTDYQGYDKSNNCYLNAGCILAKKTQLIELIQLCKTKMKDNSYVFKKSFEEDSRWGGSGSDQGVWTWMYNMVSDSKIKLDYLSNFTLNTYQRSTEEYYTSNGKLYSKSYSNSPCFVHDNGWDHGSPKYHDYFELEK